MSAKNRIDELKCEIERLEGELAFLSEWEGALRARASFSAEEKQKVFDLLYDRALHYVKEAVERGYTPKDGDHYIFEVVMVYMLGDGVWDVINSATG